MNPRVPILLSAALGILLADEPARIEAFTAMPAAVRRGSPVTLAWTATGTDRVKLHPLGVELPAKGSISHPLIGRTTFWLSAVNVWGGQTLPVVVDVLPDEPAPAPIAPPPPVHTVPPPAPVRLAPPPVPAPTPSLVPQAGSIWIQFAALSLPEGIARLQEDLRRAAGLATTLSAVPDPRDPRRTLQRVRLGPFATPHAAKARLQELQPRLAGLGLKPYVDRGHEPAGEPRRKRSRAQP